MTLLSKEWYEMTVKVTKKQKQQEEIYRKHPELAPPTSSFYIKPKIKKPVQHRATTIHDLLQRQADKMNLHTNREHLIRKYAPSILKEIEKRTQYYGA
jgi:hypothetical protein